MKLLLEQIKRLYSISAKLLIMPVEVLPAFKILKQKHIHKRSEDQLLIMFNQTLIKIEMVMIKIKEVSQSLIVEVISAKKHNKILN